MKGFFKVIGVLIVIVILGGMLMPTDFEIKRRTKIQAAPEYIHPFINNLAMWSLWTPWQDLDVNRRVTIGQPGAGVGANQIWTDSDGGGSLTIVNSDPDKGIRYEVFYGKSTEKYDAVMHYRPITTTMTEVTWSMSGHMDVPIFGPYLALAADTMIGGSFETGLQKLKQVVEDKTQPDVTEL